MLRRILFALTILMAVSFTATAQAQRKTIRLGEKSVTVKGTKFNEIEYNFSDSKSKLVAYHFRDKSSLVITEISYEFENGRYQAVKIEVFSCPLFRIKKDAGYVIEMEHEAVRGGKYWRLTLVSDGSGADNLFFQKQIITPETAETQAVNNLTINISNKIEADKWLKLFMK